MKAAIQRKSEEENLASSRLPTFSEEEKKMIKGTSVLHLQVGCLVMDDYCIHKNKVVKFLKITGCR